MNSTYLSISLLMLFCVAVVLYIFSPVPGKPLSWFSRWRTPKGLNYCGCFFCRALYRNNRMYRVSPDQ